MEEVRAIRIMSALAHESRLRVFRLLSNADEEGVAVGRIAEELDLPGATLSFHLKELLNADLVVDRRAGRSVFYSINTINTRSFINYLLEDCCAGKLEIFGQPSPPIAHKTRKRHAM